MDVSKLRSGEDVDTVLVCNDYCDTDILNCEDEAMCNDQVSHPPLEILATSRGSICLFGQILVFGSDYTAMDLN